LKLQYVTDQMPGIRRVRRGRGFAYQADDGHWLTAQDKVDQAHLHRIRSLAIPPAYEQVWICPLPTGHMQATGRDARGRKQYRYHPQWRERQEGDKFDRLLAFGEALPRLRRRVSQALASPIGRRPGRDIVLATLIRLLDTTLVRVGNEVYARDNRSYGLTTLRARHVQVQGSHLALRFRGKSGVLHDVQLDDPRVAAIVRRCQDMPGQELFQYVDDEGIVHAVGSAELNEQIRHACGEAFTAKDFRTWHATVHAWARLSPCASGSKRGDDPCEVLSQAARKRLVNEALREVAGLLGNTLAVCRKSYVHPHVLECALLAEWPEQAAEAPARRGLNQQERALLAFLKARSSATGSH
jgi:DNA topoisomerase-1